jgi:DNA-binding NarL/FixJ family response regulator
MMETHDLGRSTEVGTFAPADADARPRAPATKAAHHDSMKLDARPARNGWPPNRIEVLVAESDTRLRSVLCWLLEHDERFCVVGQASTEDQAVACETPFDLALVGLRLSGLGGRNVIGSLLQRDPVPAVVVLAEIDPIYLRHAAADEGAIGYLVTPGDLEQLGDRLAELCQPSRTGGRRAAAEVTDDDPQLVGG